MDIPVIHFFDNNYVIPAAVSFYSMLENASKEHNYILYVGHSDITLANRDKLKSVVSLFKNARLEFIDMHDKFSELFEKTKSKGHFSKEIYYKFLVSSLLPQYDKVIVTDVDVVFTGDIANDYVEFDVNTPYYFGGVKSLQKNQSFLTDFYKLYEKNFSVEERSFVDFAGGYYIFNCKKIREDGMEQKFLKFAVDNVQRLIQPEQDVINICCKGMKKALHPRALVCTYLYDMYKCESDYKNDLIYDENTVKFALEHPIQVHYATSVKPWNSVCQKQELWFYYLTKISLFKEYMEKIMPKNKKTLFKFSIFGKVFSLTKEYV